MRNLEGVGISGKDYVCIIIIAIHGEAQAKFKYNYDFCAED